MSSGWREAALRALLVVCCVLAACVGERWEGQYGGECDDAADNDLDTLFDCMDPDCAGAPTCQGAGDEDVPSAGASSFSEGAEVPCAEPFSGLDRLSEEGAARGLTEMVRQNIAAAEGGDGAADAAQGGPLAAQDLDGDGDIDLAQGPRVLYINDGTGHFSLIEGPQPISSEGYSGFLAAQDLNGDGLVDLVAPWQASEQAVLNVWLSDGVLSYGAAQQISVDMGWDGVNPTIALGDVDGDGDLDLAYITGGWDSSTGGGFPTHIYENEDGYFSPMMQLNSGGAAGNVSSQVALFSDRDGDGDADLFVGNDWPNIGLPSAFWRNEGADAGGTPVLVEDGQSVYADLDMLAMGIDGVDLNGDLLIDYCITDVGPPICLVSGADGLYVQQNVALGLYPQDMPAEIFPSTVGWSLDFVDLDNDGWVEALQASAPDSVARGMGISELADLVWKGGPDLENNNPDVTVFDDVTVEMNFANLEPNYSLVTADFDGNGWVDVATAGPGHTPNLYMNRCGAESWVEIDFIGPAENTEGLGVWVEVEAGGRTQVRELYGLRATGQGPSRLHFGLGSAESVDRLFVRWPGGEVGTATGLGVRRTITATPSRAAPSQ